MARLLKTKMTQRPEAKVFEARVEYTSDIEEQDVSELFPTPQTSEFVVYDNTIIKFGKLKGKPHSELLKPENLNYANWIINQNKNEKFYYKATCKYLEKRLRPTADNPDITSTDYIYLADKTNPTQDEVKRMRYFENNLSSYFVKLHETE
jgi:hypothetical protein